MATPSVVPNTLRMPLGKSLPLPHHPHLVLNHQGQIHPLIAKNAIIVVVWTVSRKSCLGNEFHRGTPSISQVKGEKVNYQITICLCQSALTDVVKKIDSFRCIIDRALHYLGYLLGLRFE